MKTQTKQLLSKLQTAADFIERHDLAEAYHVAIREHGLPEVQLAASDFLRLFAATKSFDARESNSQIYASCVVDGVSVVTVARFRDDAFAAFCEKAGV